MTIYLTSAAAFRSKLPSSYTFDFISGPFESSPAAGVKLFFPPPYYSFYENTTDLLAIRASFSFLTEHIQQNGPYDGVLCFSQGCAVVAGYLLDHAATRPHEELPFKCAIFICGGVPMPIVRDLGIEISERALLLEERSRNELFAKASSVETVAPGTDYWAKDPAGVLADLGVDEDNPYNLDVEERLKINIPTVHIYGEKDPRKFASLNLKYFCKGERRDYNHAGGHDVPRTTKVSETIASLVEWCSRTVGQGK